MSEVDDIWGHYADELPCKHLLDLRRFLEENQMSIWAEHSEGPQGWVNVRCEQCNRTHEITLREPFEVD